MSTIVYYAHIERWGDDDGQHELRRLRATALDDAKVEALLTDSSGDYEADYTTESRIERIEGLRRVRVLEVVEERDLSSEIAAKLATLRVALAEEEKRRKREEIRRLQRELKDI